MTTQAAGRARGKSTDRDRFYVQKDKHPVFQKLSQGHEAPFRQMKEVWVLAAAIGFEMGRRQEMRGGTQHVGFWHYLSPQEDIPLLQAIAIAESGDIAVLADQDQVIRIAEEYANAGIDILADQDRGERDSTIRAIATSIVASRPPTAVAPPGHPTSDQLDARTLIARGESARTEFKETARFNASTKQPDKMIEHEVVKAVAGFLNSKTGGTLLIGITDGGVVVGLDRDLSLFRGRAAPRDAFENWVTTLLANELGAANAASAGVSFEDVDGVEVCRIEVEPSDRAVYAGTEATFYVRANNTTRKLNARDATEYSARRWPT